MKSIKKNFPLALAILFTIFTLPVNGLTVLAEGKIYDDIKDGTHNITAKAMNADKDDASGAARFLNEEAKLIIKDGKSQLVISVPHNDMASIEGIQIEGKEATIEEKDDHTIHTFNLSSLKKELNSQVQYAVPAIGLEHDVAFRFILEGLDELPKKDKIETKTETKTEEIEFEEERINDSTLEKGKTKVKQTGQKGEKEVTYEVTYSNGKETNRKIIKNEIIKDPVNKIILIGMKEPKPDPVVEVKEKANTEKIEFETIEEEDSSLEKGKTKIKQKGINGSKEVTYDVTYTDGMETDRKPTGEEKVTKEPVDEIILIGTKKVDKLIPDKAYEINPTIKHEDGKKDSIADGFFKNKAILLEKDGETYIQMTVTNGDMIKSFKNKHGEDYVEALVVEIDDKGAKTLQLRVKNDLSNMPLNMHIVVPGLYDTKHKAILVFDKSSKKEIKVGEHRLAAFKGNKNGPEIKGENPLIEMKEEIKTEKIKFDTIERNDSTLEKGKTKVKQEGVNGTKIITYKVTYTDGKVTKREVKKNSIAKDPVKKIILIGTKGTKEPFNNELKPDKAYKINYTIKQEDGIKDSIANDFFTNTGILLEKDGKTYLQMAIENGDMIKDLKGKYGEAIVVKKEKDGSTVVQLRVDNDLANMLLKMHVIVPEGAIPGFPGYNEDHKALLVFDKASKQEIEVGDLKLAAIAGNDNGPVVSPEDNTGSRMGNGSNGNNENGTPKSKLGTNNTENIAADLKNAGPSKPEFGSNNNKDKNQDKSKNPQTGDLTNIWLYAFLLAGSMLILGIKFRRRTI